jgi:transcriptional regulator with XRE-family HTH domain
MSMVSNFLRKHMEKEGLNQKELSLKLGILVSHLNHILHERRRSYNVKTVSKMVQGISGSPLVQAEFLTAYLLDQCTDQNRHLVSIKPSEELDGETQVHAPVQVAEEHTPETNGFVSKSADIFSDFAQTLRHRGIDQKILNALEKLAVRSKHSNKLKRVIMELSDIEISSSQN